MNESLAENSQKIVPSGINWRKYRSQIVLTACMLITIAVMLGWFWGIEIILSIIPGSATMKFNTALAFLFALFNLSIYRKIEKKAYLSLYITLSVLIILIGVLTLLEYLGIFIFELDNLFVMDPYSEIYPGRMSPATALCFVFTGLGFLGLHSANKILSFLGEYTVIIVSILSLGSIINYFLRIPAVNKTIFFQTMAIHTSVLFMFISLILVLKNPHSEFSKIIKGKFAGNRILRSLLPMVIVLPVILSFFLLSGINQGLINVDFGVASFALILIALNIVYLSIVASGFNKSDIKKQKLENELQSSIRDLIQFQKGLDEGYIVAITDSRGVIQYVNDKFCAISKFSQEELIGNTHAIINSGYHKKAFFKQLWKTISSGEIWIGEIKNKAKDGSFYWVHTTIIPFKNGEGTVSEYLSIRQDITKKKESEELLTAHIKALEYKNKELEQFAYIASHDLQEPLRTIISLIDLLEKKYSQNFDETGLKSMRFVKESVSRMSQLIKSLLDYSRIGTDKKLDIIYCNKLVQEIQADLADCINEMDTKIIVDKLPKIKGYKTELRLLFQNLISNAIKFHRKGISPQIHISAQEEKNHWKFIVRDNGIGIPEESREKIFVIFQRLHPRDQYEGTGIGLSHCRKIVNLHGGDIWVESQSNAGSTFYFTIQK